MKRGQIVQECEFLNEDELEIVLLVAQGLRSGRDVYGPMDLDYDQRDSKQEAIAELRDCLVYTNMAVLKLLRGR
jgi:hypothetical protein